MAKKPSSKANETPDEDKIIGDDAAEETSRTDTAAEEAEKPDEKPDDAPEVADETKPDADTSEETSEDVSEDTEASEPEDVPEPAKQDDAPDVFEPVSETTPAPVPVPAPAPQPAQKVGAAPLVMGGIAAGAIGFAAAYFGLAQQPDAQGDALTRQIGELTQTVEAQAAEIATLSDRLAEAAAPVDLSALETAIEAQTGAIGGISERLAASETQLETLDGRLREVELRPVSESASAAAIAAYERELEAAREEIASQREELQALIDKALSTENAADDAARAAMQRAAISRILAALDSGAAYSGAMADLQNTGASVPDALAAAAETGVASLSSLQESYPAAARAALSASRAVSGDGTGLTGFLRNQLGARSLEPREGNDPDAVLSRAEAALRDGRLRDALAEIEALPEEGRAELSNWAGQVALRLEAVGAAQALSETLN